MILSENSVRALVFITIEFQQPTFRIVVLLCGVSAKVMRDSRRVQRQWRLHLSENEGHSWITFHSYYADRDAGEFGSLPWCALSNHLVVLRTADFFKHRGSITENSTVLEIGCGAGRYTIPFAKKVHKLVASDISTKMLAFMEENARGGLERSRHRTPYYGRTVRFCLFRPIPRDKR